MKVVNSIKAHGYLEDVNYPMIVFNSMDPRFKDRSVIRKSPKLVQEIISTGRFVYDAGAHRELAWQSFESHPAELPKGVKTPEAFMFEVLVNVDNSYDFYIIGKKHNKITQAQNDEKLIDYINQAKTMWERVQLLEGKRKKPTSADALRLNMEEFGEEDMKHTKFNAYFNFATVFAPSFLKKLDN